MIFLAFVFWLKTTRHAEKKNLSGETSTHAQMAWFITLGCAIWSHLSNFVFLAILHFNNQLRLGSFEVQKKKPKRIIRKRFQPSEEFELTANSL